MKIPTISTLGLAVVVLVFYSAATFGQSVDNGDFENGHAGWSGGAVVPDAPHHGAACLRIVDDDPQRNVAAATVSTLPVSHGRAYLLEIWVRGAVDGQEVLVVVEQYDSSDMWISGNNLDFVVTTGVEWTVFRQDVRAFHPDATGVRISLYPVRWTQQGELRGTAWFDDVRFEETLRGVWIRATESVKVWRSPVEQKVPQDRLLDDSSPTETEVAISAARGEKEPFQLVLLPDSDDALLEVSVSPLQDSQGAAIEASALSLREVAYVQVVDPSDHGSVRGRLPDPLPLLDVPLALSAGQQQPIWCTLRVPDGAPPGDYRGSLSLRFQSAADLSIPLRLHVWDFDMPKKQHLRTAYGLSLHMIDRYHNSNGDRDKRSEVFGLYLQDFADHRMSPQDPLGDDGSLFYYPAWNWHDGSIVPDPVDPQGGNKVLEVSDQRTDEATSVHSTLSVVIDRSKSYTLSWAARTKDAHDYLVSVNQYDARNRWIPGHNVDLIGQGDGTWQSLSVIVPPSEFAPQAVSVRFALYARRWTAAGGLEGLTWFDNLSFVEQLTSQNLISNGDFDLAPDQVEVDVDFSAFDRAAELAFGVHDFDSFRLRLPNFASSAVETGVRTPTFLGFEWGTHEYEALFTRALQALTAHLEERGWLDRAYAYQFDEPNDDEAYAIVDQGLQLLEKAAPNLKRLLTVNIGSGEVQADLGRVSIWVPQLDTEYLREAEQLRDDVDELWWYVSTGVRAPYPGNFVDHHGIENRVRMWLAWAFGIEGSLYWNTTYWHAEELCFADNNLNDPDPCDVCDPDAPDGWQEWQDPWADPMSYTVVEDSESPCGRTLGQFGNGDGRLIYPPRDWKEAKQRGESLIEGPTPSIRWELLREGIEDFEYLWLLQDASNKLEARGIEPAFVEEAQALLDLPSSIVTSLTRYTSDPGALRAHRESVAELLERILPLATVAFLRGDCNGDGEVDISDPLSTLLAVFRGELETPCDDACDSNDDGAVDISDAIMGLDVLFLGQGPVPLPGIVECGVDPTVDEIGCTTFGQCP